MQQPTTTTTSSGATISQRLYPGLTPNEMAAAAAAAVGRYSPPVSQYARNRHSAANPSANSLFGATFDDPLFQARAEAALAASAMDVKNVTVTGGAPTMLRPADVFGTYQTHLSMPTVSNAQMPTSSADFTQLVDVMPTGAMDQHVMAMQHYPAAAQFSQYPMAGHFPAQLAVSGVSGVSTATQPPRYPPSLAIATGDQDTDPRELERFAEHFKQRRIKLGVTQADVGKALAHLKMAGVGSLSQSTICRFESLTLSHNNMVALKPILQAWLEKAEEATKIKETIGTDLDPSGILPNTEKKRKRTSIAAPEKRLLEDYFRQQPRPSGERIAAIADKLDLKKNVVRVWFCNQRQKQKRCRNQTAGRVVPTTTQAKCPSFPGYFTTPNPD